jgi:hypothetical protein
MVARDGVRAKGRVTLTSIPPLRVVPELAGL